MLWTVDGARPGALHEQIAADVRRAVIEGSLRDGERLPPAGELAGVLGVNANTVLHAYRTLRTDGVLEFRRGRGVRVHADSGARAPVVDAARRLVEVGRRHGYSHADLAGLLAQLGTQPEGEVDA